MRVMRVLGLASLYEPLEFLEERVENLNSCDLSWALIHWRDCSSEPTWREVEKILRKSQFPQRVTHVSERETLYKTWNEIIIDSGWPREGPVYIANVNVDDVHAPEYFKVLSGYLDSNPECQIVAPQWYHLKKNGQEKEVVDVRSPNPKQTMGHFPMWRASAHTAVGLFDPRMLAIGDSDFWGRVLRKFGYKAFGVYKKPLAAFLLHEKNLYFTSRGPNGQTGEGWDRQFMGT